jgi:hypothetical protein
VPTMPMKINELVEEVNRLLEDAYQAYQSAEEDDFGAVNWGSLRLVDVERRQSVLINGEAPYYVVMIGEADPDCRLPSWLGDHLNWPNVYFECSW